MTTVVTKGRGRRVPVREREDLEARRVDGPWALSGARRPGALLCGARKARVGCEAGGGEVSTEALTPVGAGWPLLRTIAGSRFSQFWSRRVGGDVPRGCGGCSRTRRAVSFHSIGLTWRSQVGVEGEVRRRGHPGDLPGLPVDDAGEDQRQARARPGARSRRPGPGRGAARP